MSILEIVRLKALANEEARNLLYGQVRRLEIGRALALDPKLLLLDERAAGLIAPDIRDLVDIIRKIKAHGVAVILIEHHMDVAMAACDTVTVLDFGRRSPKACPRRCRPIRASSKPISGLAAHHVTRRVSAHSAEGRHVFPTLNVRDNLLLGAFPRLSGMRPKGDVNADLKRMYDLFPRFYERREQHAGALSGGEQQMLAMARALMLQLEVLLLDEPSMGLAPNPAEDLLGAAPDAMADGVAGVTRRSRADGRLANLPGLRDANVQAMVDATAVLIARRGPEASLPIYTAAAVASSALAAAVKLAEALAGERRQLCWQGIALGLCV